MTSRVKDSERGSMLVEALVGAALVAVVALGLLGSFDGAAHVSGVNKARAIAASLAQDDQERLRSLSVGRLSNLRETGTRVVAGVSYAVDSRADWISDPSSTPTCTSNGAGADYLQITSTVSTNGTERPRPVEVRSIVTPPNGTFGVDQGSAAIIIVDRTGAPVSGVPVSIAGPASATDTTDSTGCAFFGYKPVGTYTVLYSKPGYVDTGGNSPGQGAVTVASQQVSTQEFQFDLAGTVTAAFRTTVGGAPATSDTGWVTFAHSSIPGSGLRRFGPDWASPRSSISDDTLFPFTSPYSVYAGDCAGHDPTTYGQTPASVTVPPGGSASVTVSLPPISVTVTRGNGGQAPPHPNANVRVVPGGVPAMAGCGGSWAFTTDPQGNLKGTGTTALDPGLPYGTYSACADDGSRSDRKLIANTKPAGADPVVLRIPINGPTGRCP